MSAIHANSPLTNGTSSGKRAAQTVSSRSLKSNEQALADTFEQVLALCARAGLVSVGLVALDGTLIAADASQSANRSCSQIRAEVERMLEEAAEVDEREDAELGEARGDELPAELSDRRSRRERLRRCKEELEGRHAAEQRPHEDNLAWRADWEAEYGRKLGGPSRHRLPRTPSRRPRSTPTDPDSRLMRRTGAGTLQGYNAQVLASPEQVIVAADLTQSAADAPELAPMVTEATEALRT